MAKQQAPKETFPTLQLRGKTGTGHPTWDGNRPILIGDPCQHAEYGACIVVKVTQSDVLLKDKSKATHTVNVAEVWFEITQVPHLAEAKPWPALLGRIE